jgi:hypothetical protein
LESLPYDSIELVNRANEDNRCVSCVCEFDLQFVCRVNCVLHVHPLPYHKSRESVKIGPHPRGQPLSRPTSFEELRLCMQKTWESLRSYISRWLSLHNTSKNISPKRAINAFRDGLIRRDFREELGRCKPKTIDHLLSLGNEWADGEDSIANPRSHRRSPDRDVDPKDQLHSSSRRVRQKEHRSRYRDSDTADMVEAGYMNNDHDDNHDGPRQGNTYYKSSCRGAGRDSRPKTE